MLTCFFPVLVEPDGPNNEQHQQGEPTDGHNNSYENSPVRSKRLYEGREMRKLIRLEPQVSNSPSELAGSNPNLILNDTNVWVFYLK